MSSPAQRIAEAKAWLLITQDAAGRVYVSGSGTRDGSVLALKSVLAAIEAAPADKFTTIVTINVDPLN